jgi:hypothetical protein
MLPNTTIMATKAAAGKTVKNKKAVRKDIEDKLTTVLGEFKTAVNEKKFRKAIEKVSKQLAARFSPKKITAAKPKKVKKAAVANKKSAKSKSK